MKPQEHLLAIDFTPRGFGWALMTGNGALVSSATTDLHDKTPGEAVRRIALLFQRCKPALLVLEDAKAPAARRIQRIHSLIAAISAEAAKKNIPVEQIPLAEVARLLVGSRRATKTELGERISERFAYLVDRIPKPRKIGHPEPRAAGLFDAIGLGLTFLIRAGLISRTSSSEPS